MIFYYTRTRKTQVAAQALHEITGLDLYGLDADINNDTGLRFAFRAIKSVISAKGCPVGNMPKAVPGEIYLCGPIWAGEMAGPLKYFIRNVDVSGTKVHLLLTGRQPSEQNRERAVKVLTQAGCQPGNIYLIATTGELPEQDLLVEQLRTIMEAAD
ncbi:MAG: hypothetical protein FWB88_06525 [Defluviitaleaceae bacterium]|nr:hypothetical protein [Defluviitaleaceae bacterium]MCL2239191.1 hypothetical protein [Defluviitaleaceae bacterium]